MEFAMTQHPLRLMVVIALFLPLLYACASRSQSSYYASEVGQAMAIEDVRVISSRLVKIEGLDESGRPGWGTAVGATVAGATAYGITESDNPAGVAITIIALVGGAIAGQFLDEKIKSSLGVEYILRQQDGDKIAVVQAVNSDKERLAPGTYASLIRGNRGYVRVVPQ
jgi:outer membrane lipoprotein SlyB